LFLSNKPENPHKVRTAKTERRTFGRFFFRFPNGEAGLDVYNRVSSFLATLSRDIRQLDELYSIQHSQPNNDNNCVDKNITTEFMDASTTFATTTPASTSSATTLDTSNLNDTDNGDDADGTGHVPNRKLQKDAMKDMNILVVCHGLTLRLLLMRYFQLTVEEFENSYNSQNAKLVIMDRFVDPKTGREFFRLHEQAKQALNLQGDVSNEKPVYWREGYTSAVDRGLLLFDEEDIDIEE
jgi:hypothetical protein